MSVKEAIQQLQIQLHYDDTIIRLIPNDAEAIVEYYKEQETWHDVNKTLPENNDEVLLTDGEDYAVGYWREDAKAWDNDVCGWIDASGFKPTHWKYFTYYEKENKK